MSLEELQVARASCPAGIPVRLGQTYSRDPPTPVVCVTAIPVPLRKSIWLLLPALPAPPVARRRGRSSIPHQSQLVSHLHLSPQDEHGLQVIK